MRAALFFFAVLAVVGCQTEKERSVSEAATAPKVSVGSAVRYDLPSFSIELPSAWVVANLTRKDFEGFLEQHAKQNPQIQEMLPALRQMAATGQVKLFAFDAAGTKAGFTDNLNVLELPTQKGATLDKLMAAGKDQLQAMQASGFKDSRVQVNGNELGVLKFDMPQRGPNGEILDLSLVQYFCISGDRQYVATFTSRRHSATQFQALANSSMQTFKPN